MRSRYPRFIQLESSMKCFNFVTVLRGARANSRSLTANQVAESYGKVTKSLQRDDILVKMDYMGQPSIPLQLLATDALGETLE